MIKKILIFTVLTSGTFIYSMDNAKKRLSDRVNRGARNQKNALKMFQEKESLKSFIAALKKFNVQFVTPYSYEEIMENIEGSRYRKLLYFLQQAGLIKDITKLSSDEEDCSYFSEE
jgi:hypothetical protein